MAKKKARATKTRTATARVVGAIPHAGYKGLLWKVRLTVARLPFYLDSTGCYGTLEQAEAEAEKWKRRTIVVSVTK